MPTVSGIHIDQQRYRLVALDGSPKKHRVVATFAGEIPAGEDPVAAVALGLKRGVKENKVQSEAIGLAVDSGLAAFRTLTLPFDDDAKIEEVLKFEIESELPQWTIDDVVVDYLVVDRKPGMQSDLLVTALPKDRLRLQLEACEAAGMEAHEAELDASALYHAAHGAGVLEAEGAELLVHVGDASTALVLVDGGRLVSMRTIRVGAMRPGAVLASVEPGEEGDEPAESSAAPAPADEADERERLAKVEARVRREILRTLSGARLAHPMRAILVAGRELPGLGDEAILDVPVAALEIRPPGSDTPLDPEFVVAYGAAVRALGADVLSPSLRREELRFTGKFERLELPLAVLCLLLVTFLAVKFIILHQQISWRERDVGVWSTVSNNFLLPAPDQGWPGRLRNPSESILNFAKKISDGKTGYETHFEELREMRRLLYIEKDKLEKELGTKTEFEQPLSALTALMLVTDLIHQHQDEIGRFAFRSVQSDYQRGTGGGSDYVQIKLDMDFHSENSVDATESLTRMREAFEGAPWCTKFEARNSKPFEDDKGLTVDGITIDVDPRLAVKI